MKKYLFLVLTLTLFFVSCNLNKTGNPTTTTSTTNIQEKLNLQLKNMAYYDEYNENNLPTQKEEYKVEYQNNVLISGDIDMYDFYLLSHAGIALQITLIKAYDKDYLNKIKASTEPVVQEGRTDIYHIRSRRSDGEYDFWQEGVYYKDSPKYKYLTMSKLNSNNSVKVGYILSNDELMTYQEYYNIMLSATFDTKNHERISISRPIGEFTYYKDLAFNENRLTNIRHYNKDGSTKSYYVDTYAYTTIIGILDNLKWYNNINELGIAELSRGQEIIAVDMERHLLNDIDNLMIHHDDPNNQTNNYQLYYHFYLETGIVEMGYIQLSSIVNNIFAKISDEQITALREIIKDDNIKDYSLGMYVYQNNYIDSIIELKDDNKATIIIQSSRYNGGFAPIYVCEGSYEIKENEELNSKDLIIKDDKYNYLFRLNQLDNKGVFFVKDESNPKGVFLDNVTDNSTFYFRNVEIYDPTTSSATSIVQLLLEPKSYGISNEMLEYAKTYYNKEKDDILLDVTTTNIKPFCKIYKYTKSHVSFLEYNGKIYELGGSDIGVYQLVDYKYKGKHILYILSSYGYEANKTEILAFDFSDAKLKKVDSKIDDGETYQMWVDQKDVSEWSEGSTFKLRLYKAVINWTDYPFNFEIFSMNDIMIDDILNCELIDLE